MEKDKTLNTNEMPEQPPVQNNQQYYQGQNIYHQPQVRYVSQPMTIRAIGTWLGILLGFIGIFCIFAWRSPEDRQEYAGNYIIGLLIGIIVKVAIIAAYILVIRSIFMIV